MNKAIKHLPFVLNPLIRFIQRHEVPGKYRLYQATQKTYGHFLVRYNISGAFFSVPWDQWCFWKNYGPENYYLDEILPFTNILNNELEAFDFFDLGADVGVVSALVNKYCINLKSIHAFEPNPKSYQVLSQNIQGMGEQHLSYNKAVSDFNGQCDLVFNASQGSDHEGHIDKSTKGNTAVVRLDDAIVVNNLCANRVFKIDVEGQEIATLKGAKNLIGTANKAVMLLELHPDVLTRDQQTAEDIFEEAEAIRPFKWLVPLLNNVEVNRELPFFEQFPHQQYDVIAVSI
jgi:FkbM family methyltransferase